MLLFNFGVGHVLQYTPFVANFSALHFTHSNTIEHLRGRAENKKFGTPSLLFFKIQYFVTSSLQPQHPGLQEFVSLPDIQED